MRLFSKLDIRVDKSCETECSDYDILDSEDDMELIDECFTESCKLTRIDKQHYTTLLGTLPKKRIWLDQILLMSSIYKSPSLRLNYQEESSEYHLMSFIN